MPSSASEPGMGSRSAYAYGRSLPVAAIIRESLADLLLGADSTTPERVRSMLLGAYWPYAAQGLVPVAISAVDLALWDAQGKRLDASLADLLGKRTDSALVCGVAGYTKANGDTLQSLQDELQSLVDKGLRSFKLTVGAGAPEWDAQRLALAREIVGPTCPLAVDAFRSFRNLDDALRRLRLLQPYDLAFVEDPFHDSLTHLLGDLRSKSGMLVTVGENLSDHRYYRPLIESGAVDLLRCDATVVAVFGSSWRFVPRLGMGHGDRATRSPWRTHSFRGLDTKPVLRRPRIHGPGFGARPVR